MKKIGILILGLVVLFAVSSFGQQMKAIPEEGFLWTTDYGTGSTVKGPGDAAADSGTWDHTYHFDIPEGMKTDTLQILFWCHSAQGAVDVDISATYAVRIGRKVGKGMSDTTNFKLTANETTLKTAHTTESLVAYEFVPSADDTFMNGTAGRFFSPTAILVEVDASGTNASDTKYWVGVVGRRGQNTGDN